MRQRWSQTRDKGHLCTPLRRGKCLSLTTASGESSGDKGQGSFCHAFNPYLWRASKVYLISICTPIKGVVKYVWDSSQRCGKGAAKLCLRLKSKACQRSGQRCRQNMSEIQVKSLTKVLANMFVFCFRHYSCTIAGFHMTSLKFKTKTSWILLSFLVLQQLKTNIYINFHFDCTVCLNFKLLRDTAFTWQPLRAVV